MRVRLRLLTAPRTADYGWLDPGSGHAVVRAGVAAGVGDHESRIRLRRALASPEPAVRRAAVTAFGRLGERHDWAIDGLIEALAEGRDTPARVAAELDRLAPRVGARVVPLLGHPASVVRFYGVRLLARHGEGVRDPGTAAEGAVKAVARARDEIADAAGLQVTAGICELAVAGDALSLYALAERALVAAKRQGAGTTACYPDAWPVEIDDLARTLVG